MSAQRECVITEAREDDVRHRVVGNEQLGWKFAVRRCVSRKGDEHYEEACLLEANARTKPEFDNSWERELITFAPVIVSELASSHDIVLADVFTKEWQGAQIYADDDSSRAIMYRQFDPCEEQSAQVR